MNPILYSSTETSFTTNGLGRLSDAISCVITEERNGIFELEMEYPITGTHYSDIKEERILFAQPRPGGANQAFRIYKISRPISGRVMVSARHISYQLNKITVKPFQASSCVGAISGIKTNSIGSNPFEFWTDKNALATFTVDTPSTVRSLLGGQTGSILDTFGTGEYEWDMYTVKLHQSRGHNNGVTLRYGKNITDLNNTADTGSVYTGIVPFWKGTDSVVILPELVLYGPHRSEYPYDMVIPVDLSSRWQDAPTVAQLRSAANSYLNSSTGWQINTNLKVSFVNLSDTEEYKEIATLQRVNLCDTVTVIHEKLGVETTAKVVKTVFNVLTERYDSIELGNSRTSLSESITEAIMEEVPTSSDMEKAIAHGTKLITGGLGGFVYLKPNANGQPEEILIMDDPDYMEAEKIWRFNKNGLGYSEGGYGGTYKQAWTMDGGFYTDWVTTGRMTATLIKTGIITGQKGSMQIDVDNGTITLGNKALVITAGNLILKANGDAIFSGELKAASGTFAGKLEAATGSFSGTVTATSGKIGPWNITSSSIWYGDPRYYNANSLYFGTNGLSIKDKFRVGSDGTLVATGVTLTGTIRASKGYIGGTSGFTIDSLKIYNGKTAFGDTAHSGIYIGTDGISVGLFRGGSASGTGVRISNSGLLETGGIRFFTGNGLNTARYGLWAKNGGTHIGSGGPCDYNSEGSGIENNPNILRNGTILYGGARVSGGLGIGGDIVAWGRDTFNIYDVDEIEAEGTISTSADGYFGGGVKALGLDMDNRRIVNSPDIIDLWEAIGTLQQRVSNLGG